MGSYTHPNFKILIFAPLEESILLEQIVVSHRLHVENEAQMKKDQ